LLPWTSPLIQLPPSGQMVLLDVSAAPLPEVRQLNLANPSDLRIALGCHNWMAIPPPPPLDTCGDGGWYGAPIWP
jgi:hypothetical protein